MLHKKNPAHYENHEFSYKAKNKHVRHNKELLVDSLKDSMMKAWWAMEDNPEMYGTKLEEFRAAATRALFEMSSE